MMHKYLHTVLYSSINALKSSEAEIGSSSTWEVKQTINALKYFLPSQTGFLN